MRLHPLLGEKGSSLKDQLLTFLMRRREVIVSAFSTIASHSSYACTILLSCMTTCMSEASRHTSPQFYELLQKLLFSTSMKQEENVETVQKCFQICSKEILAAESLSSIPSGLLTVTLTIIEFLETVETVNSRSSHQFILPDLTLHLNHLLSAPWGHAKVRHRAYGVLLRLCSTHCERNELLADVTNNMENRTENGRALLQFIANHLIELHQKTSPVTMGLNNTRFQWSYYPVWNTRKYSKLMLSLVIITRSMFSEGVRCFSCVHLVFHYVRLSWRKPVALWV